MAGTLYRLLWVTSLETNQYSFQGSFYLASESVHGSTGYLAQGLRHPGLSILESPS